MILWSLLSKSPSLKGFKFFKRFLLFLDISNGLGNNPVNESGTLMLVLGYTNGVQIYAVLVSICRR